MRSLIKSAAHLLLACGVTTTFSLPAAQADLVCVKYEFVCRPRERCLKKAATAVRLEDRQCPPGFTPSYSMLGFDDIEAVVNSRISTLGTGPRGPIGPQGPGGPIGPVGPAGSAGEAGPVGQQGPAGAPGERGPAGERGATGAAGPQGVAGPAGAPGARGPNGERGATGPAGARGEVGPIGPQGPVGVAGPVGPVGPVGPAGPVGAVGPVGPAGPAGLRGATGPIGPIGPMGPQGPVGPQGAAGERGPAGARGEMGPMGPMGLPGPAGASGAVNQQWVRDYFDWWDIDLPSNPYGAISCSPAAVAFPGAADTGRTLTGLVPGGTYLFSIWGTLEQAADNTAAFDSWVALGHTLGGGTMWKRLGARGTNYPDGTAPFFNMVTVTVNAQGNLPLRYKCGVKLSGLSYIRLN